MAESCSSCKIRGIRYCLICHTIDTDKGFKYLSRQIRKASAINTYLHNKPVRHLWFGSKYRFFKDSEEPTIKLNFKVLTMIPPCQDLQAEHMNMRIIDCIHCYVLMEEGPGHRLIVVLHLLVAD